MVPLGTSAAVALWQMIPFFPVSVQILLQESYAVKVDHTVIGWRNTLRTLPYSAAKVETGNKKTETRTSNTLITRRLRLVTPSPARRVPQL